jgi:hypothetical protein
MGLAGTVDHGLSFCLWRRCGAAMYGVKAPDPA